MSGELEAAGALATAGLAAGAIEGREPGGVHDGACLNCGTAVVGPYCSQCGQATHPHRSLGHMIEEFLHGILHFDTKAWRTLPMLAFRPGTLTRDYVYGKRARYISPLALFLFTVFFMFFVFAFAGGPSIGTDVPETTRAATVEDLEEARTELAQAREELAQAQTNPSPDEPEGLEVGLARGAVRIAEAQVERLERGLAERQAEAAPTETAEAPAAGASAPTESSEAPATARTGVFVDDAVITGGEQRWQDELRNAVENGDVTINLGHPYLNEKARHTLMNPDLALYKIQQALYKFSFLLVPISLPFLALLFFWKRGVTFYDHVVFILYSLSFVSILFLAVALLMRIPGGWGGAISGLLVGAIPVHWFFQLGGAYKLGWFSALWRTFALTILTQITLSIFVLIILIVGLAG